MKFPVFICFIVIACLAPWGSYAQDSVAVNKESITDTGRHVFQPNPKKAALFSAILPGLGQTYNRQYWKVPVIYAGIGAAGYFLIYNSSQYQTYRKAYIGRLNNPTPNDEYVGVYSTDALKQLQDGYKKYLDLTVLLTGVGYMVQVLDALSAAHLKNFDVSRDITIRLAPIQTNMGPSLGFAVNFR